MGNPTRTYTEISRTVGIVTVAESGVYAQGTSPANEASLDIEYVQSATLVDTSGSTIVFNFAPAPVAITTTNTLTESSEPANTLRILAASRAEY